MTSALIVDGYNVIHAWPDLKQVLQQGGLEAARDQLVRALAEYAAATGRAVSVVFDAHSRKGEPDSRVIDGVTVHYGSSTASADHVIERLAYTASRRGDGSEVMVATSDGLQRAMVSAMGVATMSARLLEEEVLRVRGGTQETGRRLRQAAQKQTRLGDRLDPETQRRLEQLRRGGVNPPDAEGA